MTLTAPLRLENGFDHVRISCYGAWLAARPPQRLSEFRPVKITRKGRRRKMPRENEFLQGNVGSRFFGLGNGLNGREVITFFFFRVPPTEFRGW